MAREWFTLQTTDGVNKVDCAIMNRAARRFDKPESRISNQTLMAIRMTYQPGMSAQDVIDKVAIKIGYEIEA